MCGKYHSEHFTSNKNQNSQRMTYTDRKSNCESAWNRGSCTGIVKTLKKMALAQKWIWLAFLMAALFYKGLLRWFSEDIIVDFDVNVKPSSACVQSYTMKNSTSILYGLRKTVMTIALSAVNSLESVCFPRCSILNLLEFYLCHRKSNKILFRCGRNS